jgi:hypothetical protein
MNKTAKLIRHGRDDLPLGLPPDFDFTTIRRAENAQFLIWDLPNHDRGSAVKSKEYKMLKKLPQHEVHEILERNFETVVDILAKDDVLRGNLEARVSCHMLQHGTNIDSLPIELPPPPIKFPVTVTS